MQTSGSKVGWLLTPIHKNNHSFCNRQKAIPLGKVLGVLPHILQGSCTKPRSLAGHAYLKDSYRRSQLNSALFRGGVPLDSYDVSTTNAVR